MGLWFGQWDVVRYRQSRSTPFGTGRVRHTINVLQEVRKEWG